MKVLRDPGTKLMKSLPSSILGTSEAYGCVKLTMYDFMHTLQVTDR